MPGSQEKQPKQNPAEDKQRIQMRLISEFGKRFFQVVGQRGIRALIFDFETEGFPITIGIKGHNSRTTVFWSNQVKWAIRKLQDPLPTSDEIREMTMILDFQLLLEKRCGVTKLIPPKITDY